MINLYGNDGMYEAKVVSYKDIKKGWVQSPHPYVDANEQEFQVWFDSKWNYYCVKL